MFLALVSILASAAYADPAPVTVVKDDVAKQLITALTAGGIKYRKVSPQLAIVSVKSLACVSRSNAALDPDQPNWYIGTQTCRYDIPAGEGPFGDKGKRLGEAIALGEAIEKSTPEDGGAGFGWDCAMGKCATGVFDLTCSIKLDVEGSLNRFSCDIVPRAE